MKIKKFFAIFMVLVLCCCSSTLIVSAEENAKVIDGNEEFMSTLCEEVDVSVVYRPFKSCVFFADYGPFLDGIVLKITYSDGTNETVTIAKKEGDPLVYVAGKYNVYTNYFNTADVRSPGINMKKIVVDTYENGVEYSGACEIDYLYIPSFGELVFMFYYMVRSVFNPIIDFYI